jgi:TRAP-type C4-dicarboxylate transport system permease small subunit
MKTFWNVFEFISGKLKLIGAACLVAMTLLTCVDVVGRFIRHPVFGAIEIVAYMGALAVSTTLAFTHDTNGHIGVEILVSRFSKKTRAVIDIVTGLMSFVFFSLVTWQMFEYSVSMKRSGEVSMSLGFPQYPVIFVVAVCFVVFSVFILKNIVNNFDELRKK